MILIEHSYLFETESQPGLVVPASNSSTWEAQAGALHHEFQASPATIVRHRLKNKSKTEDSWPELYRNANFKATFTFLRQSKQIPG
jgi:hypothetical protein